MKTIRELAITFLEERVGLYDAALDAHEYGNLSAVPADAVAGWKASRAELISVIAKIKSGVLT